MNRKNSGANTNSMQMCLDILTLAVAYVIGYFISHGIWEMSFDYEYLAIYAAFTIVYVLANKEARIYNVTLFFYMDRFWRIITKSWLMSSLTTAMLILVTSSEDTVRRFYFTFLAMSYILLLINMVISRFMQFITHNYRAPKAAFVGNFEEFQKFNYFLNKTSIKLDEIGYILRDGEDAKGLFNVLGHLDELEDIIRNCEVDQIYFMQKNDDSNSDIQKYIDICMEMGVTVKVLIDAQQALYRSYSFVSTVGTYPVITYHTITLNNYEQMIKRLLDIFISIIGIIISSPIMLVTALLIKKDSPGPVIFKQVRVGQNGRKFHIFKFRSMYIDAEERKAELLAQNEMSDGLMFKMKDDPRITPIGKFIRKTSIDELPQLFNVVLGSMSLVGTRPPTLDEVKNYKRSQWRRISIKPGITGLWQISGRSNITNFDEVVELDLKYIDNWTLFLDIKILFRTFGVLFGRNGAY